MNLFLFAYDRLMTGISTFFLSERRHEEFQLPMLSCSGLHRNTLSKRGKKESLNKLKRNFLNITKNGIAVVDCYITAINSISWKLCV